MKHTLLYIAFAAALFASCGQGNNAKSHVKAFIDSEMGLNGYKAIAWSNVDSTFHITDSALQVIHKRAVADKIVKAGAKYAPRTEKLNIITLTYSLDKDTMQNTFYLDDNLEGVVAVKKDILFREK